MLLLSGVGAHTMSSSDNGSMTCRVAFFSAAYFFKRKSISNDVLSNKLTPFFVVCYALRDTGSNVQQFDKNVGR